MEGEEILEDEEYQAARAPVNKAEQRRIQRSVAKSTSLSNSQEKMVDLLNESYRRLAKAKICVTSELGWMQMNADGVRGQRDAVNATVDGIQSKLHTYPCAPVNFISFYVHC
jgi:hypothetical protein